MNKNIKLYIDRMGCLHIWESWEQENVLKGLFVQASYEIQNAIDDSHLTADSLVDLNEGYTAHGSMSPDLWETYKQQYA